MRYLRRWLDRQHAAEIADMQDTIAFFEDWLAEKRADCNALVDQVDALEHRTERLAAHLYDVGNAYDLDEAKRFAAAGLAEDGAALAAGANAADGAP